MLSLQSSHPSNKPQFLQQAVSPSFRNKRIPSAHDSYSYSSNHNLKVYRNDSPSKMSEKLKRRKSQYINSSSSYLDKNDSVPQKKKSSKSITQITTQVNQSNHPVLNITTNNSISPQTPSSSLNNNTAQNNLFNYPQNIITEMNCLKNEYKQLKSAYQQLIEEKINNSQKMAQIKNQNRKLEAELEIALQKLNSPNQSTKYTIPTSSSQEQITTMSVQEIEQLRGQNMKLKQKNSFLESELQRIKKECYKLLQAEKFKCKKLQQSLKQKGKSSLIDVDDLLRINKTRQRIVTYQPTHSQTQQYSSCLNNLTELSHNSNITQSLSSKNIIFASNFNHCKPQIFQNIHSPKMVSSQNIHNFNRIQQKNILIPNVNIAEESLFISQDKSFIDNNQSQFISISLTSVMDDSICRVDQNQESKSLPKPDLQLLKKMEPKLVKSPQNIEENHLKFTESTETVLPHLNKQPSSKRQKLSSRQNQQNIIHEPNYNMKKMRKEVHHKLEINLNHFENKKESFLNLKTPLNTGDKKLMGKNKNSKSKKKEQDKENNLNYYHGKDVSDLNIGKNSKKKDKNHSLTHK